MKKNAAINALNKKNNVLYRKLLSDYSVLIRQEKLRKSLFEAAKYGPEDVKLFLDCDAAVIILKTPIGIKTFTFPQLNTSKLSNKKSIWKQIEVFFCSSIFVLFLFYNGK